MQFLWKVINSSSFGYTHTFLWVHFYSSPDYEYSNSAWIMAEEHNFSKHIFDKLLRSGRYIGFLKLVEGRVTFPTRLPSRIPLSTHNIVFFLSGLSGFSNTFWVANSIEINFPPSRYRILTYIHTACSRRFWKLADFDIRLTSCQALFNFERKYYSTKCSFFWNFRRPSK